MIMGQCDKCGTLLSLMDDYLNHGCAAKMAQGGIVDPDILVTVSNDFLVPLDFWDRLKFMHDPVIKGVIDTMFSQYEKGLKEYGKPLSACGDTDYDWRLMIIEELIDVTKYQQKEIIRLERLLNPSE